MVAAWTPTSCGQVGRGGRTRFPSACGVRALGRCAHGDPPCCHRLVRPFVEKQLGRRSSCCSWRLEMPVDLFGSLPLVKLGAVPVRRRCGASLLAGASVRSPRRALGRSRRHRTADAGACRVGILCRRTLIEALSSEGGCSVARVMIAASGHTRHGSFRSSNGGGVAPHIVWVGGLRAYSVSIGMWGSRARSLRTR